MKDLRIEIRFKNQRLFELAKAAGSVPKFAASVGVSYQIVLDLLSCRRSAKQLCTGWPRVIEWRPVALKIAEAVGIEVEDLFPDRLYPPPRVSRPRMLAFAVDSTKVLPLSEFRELEAGSQSNPEALFANNEKAGLIAQALETLTPREKRVVKMRFGLDGEREHTIREIGRVLDVIPERVRQIEAKGLRKLRHPSRARALNGRPDYWALDEPEPEA